MKLHPRRGNKDRSRSRPGKANLMPNPSKGVSRFLRTPRNSKLQEKLELLAVKQTTLLQDFLSGAGWDSKHVTPHRFRKKGKAANIKKAKVNLNIGYPAQTEVLKLNSWVYEGSIYFIAKGPPKYSIIFRLLSFFFEGKPGKEERGILQANSCQSHWRKEHFFGA